ncbi:MAG: hypothetical protein QUS66_03365 [Bacteroidota bacterium]|nr:hypothetical protein [Bacteroidota bacterium]
MRGSGNTNKLAAFACLLLMVLPAAVTASFPGGQTQSGFTGASNSGRYATNQAAAYPPAQPADTLPAIMNHPLVAGTESVIMINDRETYIAGENVWFSMNARISGRNNLPRSLAGYAEILNPAGMPVAQCRVLLDGRGTGNGLLSLPDSVSSGDYILRGYTRAMTSLGPEHFFTRVIRVFNPYNLGTSYTSLCPAQIAPGPAVMLYPEGGSLIFGRSVKVAVRTTGRHNEGIPARVVLYSGDRTRGDTIYTGENGLGYAFAVSDANGRLSAEALIDSTVVSTAVTGHRPAAHGLAVTQLSGGGTGITVMHAPGETASAGSWLYLAVINRNGLAFLRKFKPSGDDDSFDLTGAITGEGISECLLYDNSGSLIASRLFMTPGSTTGEGTGDNMSIAVDGNTLQVVLPDDSMNVTLSASICGNGHLPCQGNQILLSEWVTAGTMADPFIRPFLGGNGGLPDELLITLRDRYHDINPLQVEKVIAETIGLSIDCSVTIPGAQLPAAGKRLFINLPGKETFLQYAVSDADGRCTFIVPPRTGSGEIVIYPEDTTQNLSVRIFPPFFSDALPLRASAHDLTSAADETVTRMSLNSQVMRIYQVTQTDTAAVMPATSERKHFYNPPDRRLVIADYIALPEMEEFFFELIPGWNLVRVRSGYEFHLFDPVTGAEIKTTPIMFIDGTCTTDPATIARLSPYITEYIDVCESYFRLGAVLLPPVVSVVTLKGDYRQQALPPQALRISYRFSSPVINFRPYPGDASGHMPRFSNTLLWAPATAAGSGRKLSFTLPGHDYNRPVTVCLAAFGSDGRPLFYSRTFDAGVL